MKAVTFGLIGLIIGSLLGAMVGSGNTYYTKKSLKDQEESVQVPLWAIIGGVVCAVIGVSLGAEVDKEENRSKSSRNVRIISHTSKSKPTEEKPKANDVTPKVENPVNCMSEEERNVYNEYWSERNRKNQEEYKKKFEEERRQQEANRYKGT